MKIIFLLSLSILSHIFRLMVVLPLHSTDHILPVVLPIPLTSQKILSFVQMLIMVFAPQPISRDESERGRNV